MDADVTPATIDSVHLGDSRRLMVYLPEGFRREEALPVVYCADGQATVMLATMLQPQIVTGYVPRTVLVGVNSHAKLRNEEYLPGLDREQFDRHRRLFVDEVSAWARDELGVASDSTLHAIFGVSNGAAFAVSVGLQHPDMFGSVIAFSVPRAPDDVAVHRLAPQTSQRFYFASGDRGAEKLFGKTTRRLAEQLKRRGHECCYVQQPGDHEYGTWAPMFPDAVRWVFNRQ